MKVRILILASSLVLVACKEQQVAPPAPQIEAPSPSPSTRYLLRRVAVATEESLYGLDAGTELQLIEERPGRLLVQAQGMQFEIDPRDTTDNPSGAERVLLPAKEGKAVRRGAIAAQWQPKTENSSPRRISGARPPSKFPICVPPSIQPGRISPDLRRNRLARVVGRASPCSMITRVADPGK